MTHGYEHFLLEVRIEIDINRIQETNKEIKMIKSIPIIVNGIIYMHIYMYIYIYVYIYVYRPKTILCIDMSRNYCCVMVCIRNYRWKRHLGRIVGI